MEIGQRKKAVRKLLRAGIGVLLPSPFSLSSCKIWKAMS